MAKIIINQENFFHNLNQIVLKTGSKEKVAIVLKDNAYGHGLTIMAALAAAYGITEAVVRNQQEADAVRDYFKRVLVLGDVARKDVVCTYAINSLDAISLAEEGASVELKVDTGMHRNGIVVSELQEALQAVRQKGLHLVGVMTHFRAADELDSSYFWQKKQFDAVKEQVKAEGFADVRFHSHNSAAILRTQHFNEDLVRVGIAAYGYSELPSMFHTPPLKPVMQLVAQRVATRRLQKGECIGYGGSFEAPYTMDVSTYNLGYGDGWCRGDASAPFITAEGFPILGRVSMDLISLPTTQDEVCIFNNAQEAARHFGTISYEITTALSPAIERVVV